MRELLRRLAPRSIRWRLVLAISAVSAAAVGTSFFALHEATGAELRDTIDEELRNQLAEFEQEVPSSVWGDPRELRVASERVLAGQQYHPESRIFAIEVAGEPTVTNQQEIVEREESEEEAEGEEDGELEGGEGEGEDGVSLVRAPPGLATVSGEETGRLRVITQPLVVDGRQVGTFRAAAPLTSIDQALEELRTTFIAVGAAVLLVSVAIAIWLAGLISGPLRRMARVAGEVDSGDLSHRIDYTGPDEVGVLADAFNGMLDRLESGFRRQREFVSDASHELRSPLTVLRGRIETLVRGREQGDELAAEATSLLREVSRMDRLVDDLLTLAKAESGTLVQAREVPLPEFAEDLRRDLPLLGARDYTVRCEMSGSIEADPDRLSQVLRNLVSNAVRHTGPDGRVAVTIAPDGAGARFAVSDDGPGIEPDQLERIFDRFHRTDEGRSRDEGGSGLGLAIARAIVEAHGGAIQAESRPGRGTTVSFELPGRTPNPGS
jgi:heavy metal sensor kinase